jgi:hypothetical protein
MKARHRFIPPRCPNANADVETSHELFEREFYDRERFRGASEFLAKAWTYQCHFNLTRKNSYQNWRTPVERLRQAAPKTPERVALLEPVFLDTLLPAAPRRRPRITSDQLIDERPAYTSPLANSPPGGQHQPGTSLNQRVLGIDKTVIVVYRAKSLRTLGMRDGGVRRPDSVTAAIRDG